MPPPPISSLPIQFQSALQGLGAGNWQHSFIIAWVSVENKQGEDKGITIIYPASLCLSYLPSSTSRTSLDYIPQLPTQLQPSPSAHPHSRPSVFSSPTSESLHSFRALTVSKSKDLRLVATEVGGYVDAVARERERERERLKRERETASPKITRAAATTPASAPVAEAPTPTPALPLPHPQPIQSFYPSPPHIVPAPAVPDGKTSPVVETVPATEPTVPPVASSSTASFDPYSMDSTWAQPPYLAMDINMDFGMDDMDMNFDINNASSSAGTGGGGYAPELRGGMEFEDAFTDDDFSFFDRPSRPTPTGHHSRVPSLTLPSGISPPHFGDLHLSGPGPPSAPPHTWTPGIDGFTPRSMDQPDSVPPDLTSWTPAHQTHTPETTQTRHLLLLNQTFEPIPFGDYHRQADGKYAVGKFAFSLPSPPAEEEDAFISPGPTHGGWRFRYDAVTDPRISLVKKLAGVKRKIPFESDQRRKIKEPRITWGDDDWQEDRVEVDDSDEEEGDDVDDDMESLPTSRPSTPPPAYLPLGPTLLHTQFQHAHLLPLCVPLRPPEAAVAPVNLNANHPPPSVPTPVSPAATMGAATERSKSLEAAAFAVAAEVVENPVWAETWRANVVGAGTESRVWTSDVKAVGKLLESVGFGLEAPTGMGVLFGLDRNELLRPLEEPMISIGKGDAVVQMKPPALRFWDKLGLDPKGGKKDLSAFVLFEDDVERGMQAEDWIKSVQNVYQRKRYGTMSCGKSSFCTKDGLVPLRYDATFRKSLGNFITSLTQSQPTIVIFLVLPVTVMSLSSPVLRQVLSVSKKVLSTYAGGQIFYQFIPESHLFSSLGKDSAYDSALDQLCASVYNRTLIPVDRLRSRDVHHLEEEADNVRRLFMAPSFTLARHLGTSKVSYVRAAHTSLDVMDRFTLLHVAYHLTACGKWLMACCVDQRGEAYNLKVWLTQGPREQQDSGVHVEEVHDSENGHELESEGLEEEYAVKKVWDFGTHFAKKGNVEWRVVFARLGVMGEKEINGNILNDAIANSRDEPPSHHSVVCVVPDAPWLFIPSKSGGSPLPVPRPAAPSRSSSSSKQPSIFTDISSTTYAVFPSNRISVSFSPSRSDFGLSQSLIPELSAQASQPVTPQTSTPRFASPLNSPVAFVPQASSMLIHLPHASSSNPISMIHIHLLQTVHSASQAVTSAHVPGDDQLLQDVTRNYYELAVLSKTKWKLDAHRGLPFHIAAVEAMRVALEKDWDRYEGGADHNTMF
ncbi:hypothetical protein CPB84DRAFT_1747003 [Gymnopilus junonius]|uniref:Mediator of RNA polymerase II transcription subunit 13 n=1 Tax=Gymnopilus junonius TaxID=109634 RepID=A0A9P5NQ44_GYMJU|nr:hypothetical protein CPB84DRAFT_1747003 [Gymnopilus junonius]